MPKKKRNTEQDEEWEMAQAALEAARPACAERFEALKKAGQLRYEADKKRNERSGPQPESRREH